MFGAYEARCLGAAERGWAAAVTAALDETRHRLIRPLYTVAGERRRAIALAEKSGLLTGNAESKSVSVLRHKDLGALIELSDGMPAAEREEARRDWKRKFERQGFAQRLYQHLYSAGEVEIRREL